jgi:hypothetical protein
MVVAEDGERVIERAIPTKAARYVPVVGFQEVGLLSVFAAR